MTWVDDSTLAVGDLRFDCGFRRGMAAEEGSLAVLKPKELVDAYVRLIEDLRPRRIVELGIFRGGSTVLLNELARPEVLVALDICEPIPLLERYVAENPSVRTFYGFDQADRDRLAAAVDDLGPLDLVLDDASHVYGPTLASFEVLFPRLRPGGTYVIEDWRNDDVFAAAKHALGQPVDASPVPLSKLAHQLIQIRACTADVVSEVSIGPDWVVVRRGEEPVDPATFDVAGLAADHFGVIRR